MIPILTIVTDKRGDSRIWYLITLSICVALLVLITRGEIPKSIAGIPAPLTKTYVPEWRWWSTGGYPLAVETHDDGTLSQALIFQLINGSTQSGKPLWLRGANLSGADLVGVNLHGAYLGHANLEHADLRMAYSRSANLSKANLSEAQLLGADLREADLSMADLYKADLRGANLIKADLLNANLIGSKYNRFTKWPEGFDPSAHGAVLVED